MSPAFVLAHPGGLDKIGCHKCAKNCAQYGLHDGEYHCHSNSPLSAFTTSSAKNSGTTTPKNKNQTQNTPEITGKVSSVVDGDTVYVTAGKKRYKIRLIGIDAPELKDRLKANKCLAKESKKYLEKLIKGKFVVLKSDPLGQNEDKYKRLLRYVYFGDVWINAELVKNGYARAYTIYPFQYTEEFGDFENQARESKLNIWGNSVCLKKK